jgi:Domain of unknown function (DUF3597)
MHRVQPVDIDGHHALAAASELRREIRQQPAGNSKELHYTGDTKNSATMNMWLHKQVMIELAKNGGKVPNSLKT